jgi:hypothetical protein
MRQPRFFLVNNSRFGYVVTPYIDYSCAGYVLYYLVRLEPFSRLALQLQGGKFDKPDRLFRDVAASWRSASSENIQDVRELIPEFFSLPDFLTNSNRFDFGEPQKGPKIWDVKLPPWAKNDPHEFVRMQRAALESRYVSERLHLWIDLVFGFKQRGPEAIKAQNVFVHITYENEVNERDRERETRMFMYCKDKDISFESKQNNCSHILI